MNPRTLRVLWESHPDAAEPHPAPACGDGTLPRERSSSFPPEEGARRGRTAESGSVGIVLLAAAAVTLMLSLAIVAVGQYLVAYAQAQAAADAAALAAAPVTFRPFGATGSARREAAIFASANGSELIGCSCPPDPSWEPRTVVITVRRSFRVVLFGDQSVEAVGRAEFIPARLLD